MLLWFVLCVENLILKTSVPEVDQELKRGMQRVRDLIDVLLPVDVPTAHTQMMGVPLPRRLVDPRPIELVPNRFPKIYAYLDDHVVSFAGLHFGGNLQRPIYICTIAEN